MRPFPWRTWVYMLLVLLPVLFLTQQIATWVRNIPNWDEFDTALDLLVAMDAGTGVRDIAGRLSAVQNEHRTVASRAIFALGYWFTGGINFIGLAVLGNLFLVGAFVQLLARVRETAPRLRLAAIFALVVFQLQHHESFFWSGASIDHLFVVLAAVVTLAALTSERRWALPAACGFGLVATFSLAHGLLVWPLGLALLWRNSRRRDAAIWVLAALVSVSLFFLGFHVNPGHRLPGVADLSTIIVFWLTLAGSSPALDHLGLAPWLGATLVAGTAFLLRRRGPAREQFAVTTIVWCLGALAMIAWGRALFSSEWAPITSRYIILSSIAWALLVWLLVERALGDRPREPWWYWAMLASLVVFNLAASAPHLQAGRAFAQRTERAVHGYRVHGTFSKAATSLYPDTERADVLIRAVEERGIFRLPQIHELSLVEPRRLSLDEPREIAATAYFIEEVSNTADHVRVRGWAFRPEHRMQLGELAVVFRSPRDLVAFEAMPELRPDVAEVNKRWDATYSGFELTLPHRSLDSGVYGVGICFDAHCAPEYIMTANEITIPESPRK